ncbi:right-handed parallel beta-helix repeat-containing protein [Stratiformator vulcanicus]|uniref:right-handed parallel beta-helix repeat-containing protein n=1 Tax=Stratiformator vulcanicus TaxID=2527980 RepID=UPI002877D646|nr:glycosyl hydrolase family 28-related protein [Stratiformator vulcanicus]
MTTDLDPPALGDGRSDDTAAIQSALDQMHGLGGGPKVIYLPPGTYRITKTLVMPSSVSCQVVGHGGETRILWDGVASTAKNSPRMFLSNGSVMTRYTGIIWDGNDRAATGIHHQSEDRFENKILHEYEAFINFRDAGLAMGPATRFASSESVLRNCRFINCDTGVRIESFNYYNEVVEQCEFIDCRVGINCFKYGEVFARNCLFERSRASDIWAGESHGHSVRWCVSRGSKQFFAGRDTVMQGCRITDWTGDGAAIKVPRNRTKPILIIDNIFEKATSTTPPIAIGDPKLEVIAAGNADSAGNPIFEGGEGVLNLSAVDPSLGVSPESDQRFFDDSPRIPGKVFDAVRDFGAGGKDSTAAAQATIDAAAAHGNDAVAYFPPGRYRISQTLQVTGGNFFLAGTGYHSEFHWTGEPGGVAMNVHDCEDVVLREFHILGHTKPKAFIAIVHRGGSSKTAVTYDRLYLPKGWQPDSQEQVRGVVFKNLTERDHLRVLRINGSGQFQNCNYSNVFVNFWDGASPLVVEGDANGDSPLSILNVNCEQLVLRDGPNIVIGDLYVEQAKQSVFKVTGHSEANESQITIGAARMHAWEEARPFARFDGYKGQFSYFNPHVTVHDRGKKPFEFEITGNDPMTLLLAGLSSPDVTVQPAPTANVVLLQNRKLENSGSNRTEAAEAAINQFRTLGRRNLDVLRAGHN